MGLARLHSEWSHFMFGSVVHINDRERLDGSLVIGVESTNEYLYVHK